jgi:hypothetical protein
MDLSVRKLTPLVCAPFLSAEMHSCGEEILPTDVEQDKESGGGSVVIRSRTGKVPIEQATSRVNDTPSWKSEVATCGPACTCRSGRPRSNPDSRLLSSMLLYDVPIRMNRWTFSLACRVIHSHGRQLDHPPTEGRGHYSEVQRAPMDSKRLAVIKRYPNRGEADR